MQRQRHNHNNGGNSNDYTNERRTYGKNIYLATHTHREELKQQKIARPYALSAYMPRNVAVPNNTLGWW